MYFGSKNKNNQVYVLTLCNIKKINTNTKQSFVPTNKKILRKYYFVYSK